jgi:hypothetical protein
MSGLLLVSRADGLWSLSPPAQAAFVYEIKAIVKIKTGGGNSATRVHTRLLVASSYS